MLSKINLSLIAIFSISMVQANDTLTVVNNLDEIFSKGKTYGQLEVMYSGHTIKNNEAFRTEREAHEYITYRGKDGYPEKFNKANEPSKPKREDCFKNIPLLKVLFAKKNKI